MPSSYDHYEIRYWFEENKYLNSYELAQKAGVSTMTICNWRRKVGIPSPPTVIDEKYIKRHKTPKMKVQKVPKEIWDNKEWLEEMYYGSGFGLRIISRMIDKRIIETYDLFRKYGIKLRNMKDTNKSKNPCCEREWLEEHYEINLETLEEVAYHANANVGVILGWLVRFGIPIRSSAETRVERHYEGLKRTPRTESESKKN
jgi:hypothetical protein